MTVQQLIAGLSKENPDATVKVAADTHDPADDVGNEDEPTVTLFPAW